MELKGAEIFEAGTWNGVTLSEADLDSVAASFEALGLSGRIPLKFGHEGDDARDGAPALGWVSRVWRDGRKLLADFADVPKQVYEAIKSGAWKFVSVELLRDVQAGTRLIPWTLDAVALLGATPPAVGTLRDLQSLTMRRRPPLQFAARLSFTRDGDDALAAQVVALQRQLLEQQQQFDIRSGRVLPAEIVRFDRRYRDDPTGRTVESWHAWVVDAPPVPAIYRRDATAVIGRVTDIDTLPADAAPDVELVHLTRAEVEMSGGRLSYSTANQNVLRAHPELAERYRHMPGVKDS